MRSETKDKAYRLGILLQILAGSLVNLAIGPDAQAAAKVRETRSILHDAFRSLHITPHLPDPDRKQDIRKFFQEDFPRLAMDISKRLAAIYGADVSNVFHFSTGVAGYLQTYRQASGADQEFGILRDSLSKQAKDLKIDHELVQRFFSSPEEEWDSVFEVVLAEDDRDNWRDVVGVKVRFGPVEFDLKKAASLISKWLKKR